jgi:hypothetical protein
MELAWSETSKTRIGDFASISQSMESKTSPLFEFALVTSLIH